VSDILGNAPGFPADSCNQHERTWWCKVTFGSGAIASQSGPDPGIVVTRTAAGTYSVAFPACPDGAISFQLLSPAPTVVTVNLLTENYPGGVATFKTFNNGAAATDPAAGDKVTVYFNGKTRAT
jgi:hypothetical protein